MEWIKQDSSKGQCPMCRQSEQVETPHARTVLTVATEFEWGPEGGLHLQHEEHQQVETED